MEGDGVPEGMGNLVFDFQAGHEEEGLSIREMPRRFLNVPVVFLAAREVLTIYPVSYTHLDVYKRQSGCVLYC